MLGSNELTDMKQVIAAAAEATNVKLDITYVGIPDRGADGRVRQS